MELFRFKGGSSPLLASIPHLGTYIQDHLMRHMTAAARLLMLAQRVRGYSAVLNGRFIGSYITRHYGSPKDGVHAVQLELTRRTYMDEDTPPYRLGENLARRVRPHVRALVEACLETSARGRIR